MAAHLSDTVTPSMDGPIGPDGSSPLKPGERLGRYVILGVAGRGAMGIVYGAYDPDLDRRVAIKVLRVSPRPGPASERDTPTARLLREAKAMAQLSHPNVLPVFDVGVADGRVFIAAEFVQGSTLADWLRDRPRTWREIQRVFLAAGAGLQAAHQAALVHRDFKPQNVLIAEDGTVRVTDFGLARRIDSGPEDAARVSTPTPKLAPAPEPAGPSADSSGSLAHATHQPPALEVGDRCGPAPEMSTGDSLREDITRAGQILGTPAYAAPEVERGAPANAASDQYSFCVSLYEGLYGNRPFEPENGRLYPAKEAERYAELPPSILKRVPEWLRQLVLRGLRAQPEQRWPSMTELLEALAHDPDRVRKKRRRNATLALLALTSLGALTAVARLAGERTGDERGQLCTGTAKKLNRVWNPDVMDGIRTALFATGAHRAPQSWELTHARLDSYAQAWVRMREENCHLTRLRGEQSEALMDTRMACLDRRLEELAALTEVLTEADTRTVDNAVRAAAMLTPLTTCAGARALETTVPPHAIAAEVADLELRLARFNALHRTGRYDEAARIAEPLALAAEELGYHPLLAKALLAQAKALEHASRFREAVRSYKSALYHAEAAGMLREKTQASLSLITAVGYLQGKHEQAAFFTRLSEALLQRLGGDKMMEAELLASTAAMAYEAGDAEGALNTLSRAVGLALEANSDHHSLPLFYRSWSDILLDMERYEQASEVLDKALEAGSRILGSEHPDMSYPYLSQGTVLMELGGYAAADAAFEHALETSNSAGVPRHPAALLALGGLAKLRSRQGRLGEAREYAEQAFQQTTLTFGPGHARAGLALLAQADVEFHAGKVRRAMQLYRQVIARGRELRGHGLLRPRKVLRGGLLGRGRCLLRQGRPREAIVPLEQARQLLSKHRRHDPVLHFALAQALDRSGHDPARALEMARMASDALKRTPDPVLRKLRARVRTWLARRSEVAPPAVRVQEAERLTSQAAASFRAARHASL